MTREEAITLLEEIQKHPPVWVWEIEELAKTIDMAIEALSKPNYETDTEVRLAVTDRNKDKVVLWDAFGEVEYYPNGEINCVKCPHYYETEDDTGVHGQCGSHGRLIDADALSKKLCETTIFIKEGKVFQSMINDAPTVQADRPHGEWVEHKWAEEYDGLLISNYECTNCHSWERNNTDFCPNCGCVMDMRDGDTK